MYKGKTPENLTTHLENLISLIALATTCDTFNSKC